MKDGLLSKLDGLVSEGRNPRTEDIDTLSTMDALERINGEDALVATAVNAVLPAIAQTVDRIVEAFDANGRLIYMGAGTSGRLGVLDASECPPTFGVPEGMVLGLIAGGDHALRHAIEGAEDDERAAVDDLDTVALTGRDVVVGLTVSGRTPYVLSALRHARGRGATAVALSCNPDAPVASLADIAILPIVGPEVLTGSTRLKSGTAQKLVLNMLTTASMLRIGKAYGNLMVDLQASNEKLKARAARVVMQATRCPQEVAEIELERAGNDVKLAIMSLLTGEDLSTAGKRLDAAGGVLRAALRDSEANLHLTRETGTTGR